MRLQWKILPALLAIALTTPAVCVADHNPFHSSEYVSLGFASQDLENPVSMFGHTFLIFSSHIPPEPSSTVVEYRAESNEESFFVLRALMGSLQGRVRVTRLLEKEREYDLEDRDLFYFPLSLSAREKNGLYQIVNQAVANPYSSGSYGFFRNNCSFVVYGWILKSVESEPPPTIAHIPLRGLKSLEMIKKISRPPVSHPSSLRRFSRSMESLSSFEAQTLQLIRYGGNLPNQPSENLARATHLFAAYRVPREPLESERVRYYSLMKSQYSNKEKIQKDPLESFYSDWFRFESGKFFSETPSSLFRLTYSPAIRNWFNYDDDEFKFSALEMGRVSISMASSSLFLNDATLIELDSIPAFNPIKRHFSRYFRVGYDYWRGVEGLFGLGLIGQTSFVASTIQPVIGFKVWGYDGDSALSRGFDPQLGLRMRLDLVTQSRLAVRFTAHQFFVSHFRPEFRMEGLISARFHRWTPFLRARQISNPSSFALQRELLLGMAFGI